MKRVVVPSGVKVGGHSYQIKTGASVSKRLKEGNFYGRCYNTEHEILVDSKMPEPQFSNSFIHEVIEAVSCVYCNSKIPHRQIENLANGLHQVIEGMGVRLVPRSQGRGRKEK